MPPAPPPQSPPPPSPPTQAATLADKRIVVAVDRWDADSLYPSGHYVRTLGAIGDKETETEVLLIENDVNTNPFTAAVHACVPPLPWSVGEADLADPNRWGWPLAGCVCVGGGGGGLAGQYERQDGADPSCNLKPGSWALQPCVPTRQ
jgi:hypothetical protein